MLFLGTLLKEDKPFSWLQELYHELHALDRFEQDYRRKLQEEDNSNATQRGSLHLVFPLQCHMKLLSAYFGLVGLESYSMLDISIVFSDDDWVY